MGTVGGGHWATAITQRDGWRTAILFFGVWVVFSGLALIRVIASGRCDQASRQFESSAGLIWHRSKLLSWFCLCHFPETIAFIRSDVFLSPSC